MPLRCKLFARDRALEACFTRDSSSIGQDAKGDYVSKIQMALFILDGNAHAIASGELCTQTFGPSTSIAVMAFKTSRNLVNAADQPKHIVDRITIAAMDREMAMIESPPAGVARDIKPPAPPITATTHKSLGA